MRNRTVTTLLSLLLLGCSSPKSYFSHPQYGKLPASSPLLEKELQGCAKQIEKQPDNAIVTKADVAIASIPIIVEENIVTGIAKGTDMLNAIKVIRTVDTVKNKTLKARSSVLNCMEKKGWRAIEE